MQSWTFWSQSLTGSGPEQNSLLQGLREACYLQASEARLASHALGGSPGPKGYPVCLSDTEDDDQPHEVTDAEAADARAAEAAAARKFGGPDHPEPLYMPGALITLTGCTGH